MIKRIFKIGCMAVLISIMSFPVWAGSGMNHDGIDILARGGHCPGDGTGNGGCPHDGTGNGSKCGGCLFPDADMTDHPVTLSRGGNGGGGNGGNGPGDGTGNGGSGPRDGSGNGSKSGTCINS